MGCGSFLCKEACSGATMESHGSRWGRGGMGNRAGGCGPWPEKKEVEKKSSGPGKGPRAVACWGMLGVANGFTILMSTTMLSSMKRPLKRFRPFFDRVGAGRGYIEGHSASYVILRAGKTETNKEAPWGRKQNRLRNG